MKLNESYKRGVVELGMAGSTTSLLLPHPLKAIKI